MSLRPVGTNLSLGCSAFRGISDGGLLLLSRVCRLFCHIGGVKGGDMLLGELLVIISLGVLLVVGKGGDGSGGQSLSQEILTRLPLDEPSEDEVQTAI